MTALPSYTSGVSDVPLLGDTIGANLERTVRRWGDREALVDVPTHRRWTYSEPGRRGRRAGARPARARRREGRPGRRLGAELRGVGAAAVRHGEGRRDPGQRQPGLPQPRASRSW
nr:hypothetical protein [Angustibacter aerolatus]